MRWSRTDRNNITSTPEVMPSLCWWPYPLPFPFLHPTGLLSPSPSNNSGTSALLSIEGPTGLPAPMSHAREEQEEDEDSLPFALEDCTDDYGVGAVTAGDLGSLGSGCPGLGTGAASALAQSGSSDAAVGALARMLQVKQQ